LKDKSIIYSEVYEILQNIDKNMVMKIPKDILLNIKKNKNADYKRHIDWNKKLSEQNLHEETINIIGYINYNFWCDTSEKKENYRKIVYNNKYGITNNNLKNGLIKRKSSIFKKRREI